jgi:HK97 family phage major capsid protein
MDALISTDIEAELPGIFAEAFGAAIDKAICVGAGSGSDALGVFIASASGVPTSSDLDCAAAGAPKFIDYQKLALNLNALSGGDRASLAILVHPNVLAVALADTAVGSDPMKNEYLQKGTIMGIPVIVTTYGLTTLTAGSYVAVGGYFKHYALAIAQQLTIDPIKTVGSDNVTFQAFMYLQGKPLVGGSFLRLKTV